MFTETITLGLDSPAELHRINQDNYSSEYCLRSTGSDIRLRIRNSEGFNRQRNVPITRHNLELVQTIFPVAPATVSTVRKVYLTFEAQVGDSHDEIRLLVVALTDFFSGTTEPGSNALKLLQFES